MTGLGKKPTVGARNHKCEVCGKPSMYFFLDGRGWRCGNHWKTELKPRKIQFNFDEDKILS